MKNVFEFEVRVGDINYGNHMGNDKALLIFHDARIRFLRSLGFSEMNIGEQTGIILNEAHLYYKKEIFLYDRLSVDVDVVMITSSSFTLEYRVHRNHDDAPVLTGTTRIIAFDYENKKVVRLPGHFMEKISDLMIK